MNWIQLLEIIPAAVAVYSIYRMWSIGYRRRHGFWTRASWFRFIGVIIAALGLAFMPAMAEVGVALGYYSRSGMTSNQIGIWILLVLAAMFGGVIVFFMALHHFAHGDIDAPFTLTGWGHSLFGARAARRNAIQADSGPGTPRG